MKHIETKKCLHYLLAGAILANIRHVDREDSCLQMPYLRYFRKAAYYLNSLMNFVRI